MELPIREFTAAILLFFQVALSLSLTPTNDSTQSFLCRPTQSIALLQFKNNVKIDKDAPYDCGEYSFPRTNSWIEGTDCCLWEGVKCNESTGNVISLDLRCSRLYGQFPTNSTLFQLSHLQRLNLACNDFYGSSISSELGRLVTLTHVNISSSGFSGTIPSQISHLSKLVSLDVSSNSHLILDSPAFAMMSKNLTHLKHLFLDSVNLSSVNPKSLLNLSALESLSLSNCQLQGQFPANVFNLIYLKQLIASGNSELNVTLPKSNWTGPLESIDLSSTGFSGGLPYSIVNLKSLYSLSLDNCGLDGQIPSFMMNLTQITHLSLRENMLCAGIPETITGLINLTDLNLNSNKINGAIPAGLFSLRMLQYLDLSKNQLSGNIPEFQSKSFNEIYLGKNTLYGRIPESMFQLSNLVYLDLSSNSLLFGIEELNGFQKLKNLGYLDLSYTNVSMPTTNPVDLNWPKLWSLLLASCHISEFPNFLRTQDVLEHLDLSNNNIGGEIPRWVMNVGKETLRHLNLSHNQLTGTLQLPWQELDVVALCSNMFHGPLPTVVPSMRFFSVSDNLLSENMPSWICDANSIEILNLSRNNFSGKIPPCLGNITERLSVLHLQKNNFEGTIEMRFSKECNLRNLNFQGNNLEGSIPNSLVNCKELEVLDLGNNMLNDKFPSWLGLLQELQVLVLRSNKLYGSIVELGTNNSFSKLLVLDLSNNKFTGHFPASCLKNFITMMNATNDESDSIYLGITNTSSVGWYDYSMTINFKGLEIEFLKIFHALTSIDLSNNQFQGEIPDDLGKLHSLRALNLSHNNISGQIPPSLGDLINLEWLDLSSNKLVGEIPEQLVDVTTLAILNLSDNQLVGHIPEGKQFNTFTVDTYRGNLGLCGNPLQSKCRDEEPEPPMTSMEFDNSSFFDHGFGWQAVAVGYGCGMIFGVGAGYIMYRYRRPRWLLLIIEDKLKLRAQGTRNSRRSRARTC